MRSRLRNSAAAAGDVIDTVPPPRAAPGAPPPFAMAAMAAVRSCARCASVCAVAWVRMAGARACAWQARQAAAPPEPSHSGLRQAARSAPANAVVHFTQGYVCDTPACTRDEVWVPYEL